MSKRKAIIVDIDGTVSDSRPREHHVNPSMTLVKDYDAFHSECHRDAAIIPIVRTVQAYADNGYHILFGTCRPNKFRDITMDWLDDHCVPYDELFMRGNDDHRNASVIKRDMLTDMISKGYHPFIAIEDRQEVVDMWRANGIHCLQTVAI